MIRWGDYLRKLAEDEVSLGEAETETLDETGRPETIRFLLRSYGGRVLYMPVSFETLRDPVPEYVQRRAVNILRLPPEKYLFDL